MNKHNLLKSLVEWTEWLNKIRQSLRPRLQLSNIPSTRHALGFTGVRQCGKTHLAISAADKTSSKILYYNFEDPIVSEATGPQILDDLIQIYSENFNGTPETLVLDEIQNVPAWEKWIRKQVDIGTYQLFITGSSSKLLSRELASSISGRVLEQHVWPLSYREALQFMGRSPNTDLEHLSHIKNYLEWGGFPDVVMQNEKISKLQLLRQYLNDIVYKDVISRNSIRTKNHLDLVILNAFKNCSALHSYSSVKKGFGIPTETTQSYMKYLEEAFVTFEVPRFFENLKVQSRDARKVYVIDNGLRNAAVHSFNEERGKLAENAVYLELRRRGHHKIMYWSMKQEVDFIIVEGLRPKAAIQVCYGDMSIADIRQRELNGLFECLPAIEMNEGTIITYDHREVIRERNLTIRCIPLHEWLLQES